MIRTAFFTIIAISTISFSLNYLSTYQTPNTQGEVAGSQAPYPQGLIIPHHELANELSIPTISKLSQSTQYPIIVVFSPNHFAPLGPTFTTTSYLKDYKIHQKYIEDLTTHNIKVDSNFLQREHGLKTPISLLSVAFPDSYFIPIVISNDFTLEKLNELSQTLYQMLPPETLYVASVDFSHDHSLEQALKFNQQTINSISNFNYTQILNYTDDHLDSPASMILLLKMMEMYNRTGWNLESNSHSALLLNKPASRGTSYIIGYFE